ncbi:MAG: hypothetical protein ACTSU9_01880, partial [Promethearchaeota archaeon]
MVPKDAFMNVDKSGDGKADSFGFYIVNVISPIAIPADIPSDPAELAKLAGVDDINSLLTVTVDGESIDFDINNLELRYEDKAVTISTLGEAAGVTVPVGGKLVVIYSGKTLTEGEHEVSIKYGVAGSEGEITVKRELLPEKA